MPHPLSVPLTVILSVQWASHAAQGKTRTQCGVPPHDQVNTGPSAGLCVLTLHSALLLSLPEWYCYRYVTLPSQVFKTCFVSYGGCGKGSKSILILIQADNFSVCVSKSGDPWASVAPLRCSSDWGAGLCSAHSEWLPQRTRLSSQERTGLCTAAFCFHRYMLLCFSLFCFLLESTVYILFAVNRIFTGSFLMAELQLPSW